MKISNTVALAVIVLLHAGLAMMIFADVHATSVGKGKAIDINPGKLRCCTNCNFSSSGLYTCDDVVKKCDPVCRSCVVVKTYPLKEVKCTDTFIGRCDPLCK